MKIETVNLITDDDWDDFVEETYGRTYCFHQQEGGRDRGTFHLVVPFEDDSDYEANEVPEIVNHPEMGVSFAAWLARDPKKPLPEQIEDWELNLWWERNFYPSVEVIANDLHKRGLLKAGKYIIEIDW
jgi:hypothetical protein